MYVLVHGYLVLDVIQQCNLNCDHCVRGENTGKRITRKVAEKIFDKVKAADCICFTGGEISLAYNEIKMVIDVMKEKNVKIKEYQIILNGTIYNKKLIDLLNNNFETGNIYISCDYFHDKSILEKYSDKLPQIMKNYENIMNEPNFKGLNYIPVTILNDGRAKNVTIMPKEEPHTIGFATLLRKRKFLYVGPEISFDVDGNLLSGSTTYEINENNHYGNIFEEPLEKLLIKNSIKSKYLTDNGFVNTVNKLENNYFNGGFENQKVYVIKKRKVKKVKNTIIYNQNQIDTDIYDPEKRLIHKFQSNKNNA